MSAIAGVPGKRILVISEQFGLWRAEASNGAHGAGGTLLLALQNLAISAGVPLNDIEELVLTGDLGAAEIFEIAIPKGERFDGPQAA